MGILARLTRFEWACVGVAALAFLLRLDYVFNPDVIWDSAWYMMLARSFSEDGTFWIRWTHDPRFYSGYWPPLYPILLSPLVKLFGAQWTTLGLGSFLMSALLTAATFFTTRDIMGRTRAFAAMALVAVSPAFMSSDARGMSESLIALTVVLTMWALLKGIDRPVWLAPALGFGFLAYMSKANLGIPFVLAGLVAFALWIGYARGWRRTFGNPMWAASGLVALGILGAFAMARTGRLGGIGVGVIEPVTRAISHPLWVPFLFLKIAFAVAFLFVVTLPFSLHVRKALPSLDPRRNPKEGTLWLATMLPLLATGIFTASFLITEKRGPLQFENVVAGFGESFVQGFIELTATIALLIDFDNVRYLTPAIVPALWLLLPHVPFERDPDAPLDAESAYVRQRAERTFGIAVGAYFVLLMFNPLAGMRFLPASWQLERLGLLLLLALIPVGIALAARRQWWDVTQRTSAKGVTSYRYVPGAPPPRDRRVTLGLLAAGAVLGYVASFWFAVVIIGYVIASASRTLRGSVIAMALVLLAATAPSFHTPLPTQDAAEWLASNAPDGTIVGMQEPIVYFAAVAPDNVKLVEVDYTKGIQEEVAILVRTGPEGVESPENFTLLRTWDYEHHFTPTLTARVAIEQDLLGASYELATLPGVSLHVRNGTAAADALLN